MVEMPLEIQRDIPLASHTTLGVGGKAAYFAQARTLNEVRAFAQWARSEKLPLHILGGGSNVLVPDAGIDGLVVQPLFSEITYEASGDEVCVTAGAGVVLDALIEELTQKGLWGLENLSGIPGTVGGVPIQNVGAYGVEAHDVVLSVEVYDPQTDAVYTMQADECAFGYRDSYFKHDGKGLVICRASFRLSHTASPRITYKDLASYFSTNTTPTVREIREAVLAIRSAKFPDWHVVGTAGSFFKNPIISRAHFEKVRARYPELPGFPMSDDAIKVSLGWILDHVCHLRGYREGSVWLYEKQALVLVCEWGTSVNEIISFSESVIARVFEATGIRIEREATFL